MARGAQTPEAARAMRSVRIAVIALVVVVAGVVGLVLTGRIGNTGVAADDLTRVLLVGAGADENGDALAQIVSIADVSGASATLTAVSPATPVTIPGTTYDTLADAYPFGGGAGVAASLARSSNAVQLPYVALDARTLAAALEGEGSVTLDLPAPMSVFDGEELFTLPSGRQDLTPEEVAAVFKGAPYLASAERAELDGELAVLLARAIGGTAYESVDTDLSDEAYAALQSALSTIR